MAKNLTKIFTDILKERLILDGAYINKKELTTNLPVIIRLCEQAELKEILALQEAVYKSVVVKETFVNTTEEELRESLEIDACIGVYHHNRLFAFTLMISNRHTSRNLGCALGYRHEELLKCVTYDTTFVLQEYKGYGLQRLFLSLKEEVAKELGACEALATVSPDNMISFSNLKASGFVIADEKKMYGVLNRYIMRKSFAED